MYGRVEFQIRIFKISLCPLTLQVTTSGPKNLTTDYNNLSNNLPVTPDTSLSRCVKMETNHDVNSSQ